MNRGSFIIATETKKGLKIEARIDERNYETGIKILDEDMAQLKISLHELYLHLELLHRTTSNYI